MFEYQLALALRRRRGLMQASGARTSPSSVTITGIVDDVIINNPPSPDTCLCAKVRKVKAKRKSSCTTG